MTTYDGLYSFKERGLAEFRYLFESNRVTDTINLKDSTITTKLYGSNEFKVEPFFNTKEMAKEIVSSLGEISPIKQLSNSGLWAWLTYVLRDQLFDKDANGIWRIGENHRWYPSSPNDWQKGQRHLVRMPVLLYVMFENDADHLLCNKPSVMPEIREQLTSRNNMLIGSFQAAAKSLYFDDKTGKLKRGAGGSGPGSPRRLSKVQQQLDVTWDFDELDSQEIINLLPSEFSRFIPAS